MSFIKKILSWFLTGEPPKEKITDKEAQRKMFAKARLQGVTAMIIGYGMYYVVRMTLGVVKKPMIDEAGFTTQQLGMIGAGMLIAIAFGKCFNGFIADRCNVKKIVPIGLLGAAVINIVLGFTPYFYAFLLLWFINGWFQSMGSAPCIVSLTQWFPKREVATQYGVFSIAHYIGEGTTFVLTAMLVVHFGWQSAFLIPGLICLFLAFVMYKFMYDRPQAYGLPSANEFAGEVEEIVKDKNKSTKEAQLEVIKNPYIWLIAFSATFLGIARYSMNSWGVLFLQEYKAYSLVAAGGVMAVTPIMGGIGSFLSGFISDKVFKSNHSLTTIFFGLVMLAGIVGVCFVPPGNPMLDTLAAGTFGFGLGVILCFIGGMLAVDLCSQKAAGAAMGTVGLLSYGGAAAQDFINGFMMHAARTVVDGKVVYNFDNIMIFWIGSVAMMVLLIIPTLWAKKNKKVTDDGVSSAQ